MKPIQVVIHPACHTFEPEKVQALKELDVKFLTEFPVNPGERVQAVRWPEPRQNGMFAMELSVFVPELRDRVKELEAWAKANYPFYSAAYVVAEEARSPLSISKPE